MDYHSKIKCKVADPISLGVTVSCVQRDGRTALVSAESLAKCTKHGLLSARLAADRIASRQFENIQAAI